MWLFELLFEFSIALTIESFTRVLTTHLRTLGVHNIIDKGIYMKQLSHVTCVRESGTEMIHQPANSVNTVGVQKPAFTCWTSVRGQNKV